jgi:hypothetical protein
MIYFGYPLDIHGWKTKPETEPETENCGWETIPNPKPQDPKLAGIRPEPDPLPSLVRIWGEGVRGAGWGTDMVGLVWLQLATRLVAGAD